MERIQYIRIVKETPDEAFRRFIALDFETTGLSPAKERIVEIGAVLFQDGSPEKEFSVLVNPGRALPPIITAITGLTAEDLQDAPREEEVLSPFLSFLGDALSGGTPLVAHNACFDGSFLKNYLLRNHVPFDIRMCDTLWMARRVLSLPNYKQDTVAAHFGIVNRKSHRATSDAETCGKIFSALLAIR